MKKIRWVRAVSVHAESDAEDEVEEEDRSCTIKTVAPPPHRSIDEDPHPPIEFRVHHGVR